MSTITPKELAGKLNSDPKTTRKFLRSITPKDEQPGKGNRWAIDAKRVATLRKEFKVWDEKRRAEIEARRKEREAAEAAEELNSDEETEELEDADTE